MPSRFVPVPRRPKSRYNVPFGTVPGEEELARRWLEAVGLMRAKLAADPNMPHSRLLWELDQDMMRLLEPQLTVSHSQGRDSALADFEVAKSVRLTADRLAAMASMLESGAQRTTSRWVQRTLSRAAEAAHRSTAAALTQTMRRMHDVPAWAVGDLLASQAGLPPRLAGAVTQTRSAELARLMVLHPGWTERQLERAAMRRTRAYADRLTRFHAEATSRTLVMQAVNSGRQEAWEELSDRGLIDVVRVMKEWAIADGDADSTCLGMQGEQVPIRGTFDTGSVQVWQPPIHVNCRCTTILVEV